MVAGAGEAGAGSEPTRDLGDNWWLFGENQPGLCAHPLAICRAISPPFKPPSTASFSFLDAEILPDDKLIAIGSDDAALLGVLSSSVHVAWALAAGATLGRSIRSTTRLAALIPSPSPPPAKPSKRASAISPNNSTRIANASKPRTPTSP
jgi:hypothetical protein